jgi:hypothetical protein
MIIKIAICLIASLIILANYKALRNPKIFVAATILAMGIMAAGIYLITHVKGDKTFYSAFISPLMSLVLLLITRIIYKKRHGKEIILYIRNLYPVRHEERFVTQREKNITLLITALAVAIPILAIELIF